MPVIQITTPAKSLQAFIAGLGTATPQLQFSLPVYTPIDYALQANGPFPTFQLVGWQFLTLDAQNKVVVGEVPDQAEIDENLTSLVRGLTVEDAWKAYEAVKGHPEVEQGNFVSRRLRMSALKIEAFWLKAQTAPVTGGTTAQVVTPDGGSISTERTAPATDALSPNDFVYCYVAFVPELKNRLVPAPEFLRSLRSFAANSAKSDSPAN